MVSMDPLIPEQPTDPGSAVADSKGQLTVVETWVSSRHIYLDNLKVLLIAAIIAGHGLVGYGALELWSYADVREVTLSPVTEGLLFSLLAPFGLFMIPVLLARQIIIGYGLFGFSRFGAFGCSVSGHAGLDRETSGNPMAMVRLGGVPVDQPPVGTTGGPG
jgi:hypothetical protein